MKINRPKNSLSTSTGSFTIYCCFVRLHRWVVQPAAAFRETAFPRQQYKRSNFLQQFGRSKICVFANRQKELSNPKVTMVNTCDKRFMLMKPDNLPRNKCYMFRKMGSSVKCGKKACLVQQFCAGIRLARHGVHHMQLKMRGRRRRHGHEGHILGLRQVAASALGRSWRVLWETRKEHLDGLLAREA